MKKLYLLIIGLILSINAAGQPVQAPIMGGGLDQLSRVIENNTAQSLSTQKTLEDLNGRIIETMSSWTGNIIFAESVFMLLIYLIIVFIDKRAKRLNKKKYEELIIHLETEAELRSRKHAELLDRMNVKIERFVNVMDSLNALTREKDIDLKTFQKKAAINGFCFGVLITIGSYFIFRRFI